MFMILETNEIDDRWRAVEGTAAVYESLQEALEDGERLELFDCIIVEYKQFI